MYFGQYQASLAALGWQGDRDCYLMHRMKWGGSCTVLTSWWYLSHLWTPPWSSHQGTWSVSTCQVGEGGMCIKLVSFTTQFRYNDTCIIRYCWTETYISLYSSQTAILILHTFNSHNREAWLVAKSNGRIYCWDSQMPQLILQKEMIAQCWEADTRSLVMF